MDSSGAAGPEAVLQLTGEKTGANWRTTANRQGFYVFPSIAPGEYILRAEGAGFKRFERSGIVLETAQTASIDVTLEIGDVSQTVTVDGGGININTVDASVSTLVNRQFVENLPLNGRSFQSLMTMTPGALAVPSGGIGSTGELSVNGQRTESNYFTVDGVSANTGSSSSGTVWGTGAGLSGSTPTSTAVGTTQSIVSVDALQEFRAITSTYSAEYGRSPGGQFSFTTRSGTNDFHGSAFDYFRNDALDANNWFSNASGSPKPVTRQNDFGGTLGGPVFIPRIYEGKDRTFFFFAYEGLRLRIPRGGLTAIVPDLELRQQVPDAIKRYVNAFPLPNGQPAGPSLAYFHYGYSEPSTLDTTSLRIDHSFTDRFKVFGRYSNSPSNSQSRSLTKLTTSNINVATVTLGVTNILSSRLSNEARFNMTGNDSFSQNSFDDYGGATALDVSDVPGLRDPASFFYFDMRLSTRVTLFYTPLDNRQRQFNITDSMMYSSGRHTFKWGFDYRRIGTTTLMPPYYPMPTYTSLDQLLTNRPSQTALYVFRNPYMKPVFTNFSAFVQDEWKVTDRLNLSLGLRWEVNPSPGDSGGNPQYAVTSSNLAEAIVAPKGTPLWGTRWANFAPRLGIAYQLRRSRGFDTLIRTGVGLFYDTGNAESTRGYYGVGFRSDGTVYNQPFPFTQEQLDAVPAPQVEPPYPARANTIFGYNPEMKLPYTRQWNFSVEQALGTGQTFTASYLGAAGRQLIVKRNYYPAALGNKNFVDGAALQYAENAASSAYHSLQLQYQRRMSRGLQAMAAYTWSHSIDDASSNLLVSTLLRGNSSFDIRHNFQAAVTYDIPGRYGNRFVNSALKSWSIDTRMSVRSALPVEITGTQGTDPITGSAVSYQPNFIRGQPHYVNDPNVPSGRLINRNAFALAPAGVQGNLGRNVVRAFGASQLDLALRREFFATERLRLQFRAEAFNVMNHPNFGSIQTQLTSAQFGQATNMLNSQLGGLNTLYQVGGPRSLQLALKVIF